MVFEPKFLGKTCDRIVDLSVFRCVSTVNTTFSEVAISIDISLISVLLMFWFPVNGSLFIAGLLSALRCLSELADLTTQSVNRTADVQLGPFLRL